MYAFTIVSFAALAALTAAVPHANKHALHHRSLELVGRSSSDGTCGGSNGSCGPGFCCSSYGYCGQSAAYCAAGCQSAFGTCSASSSSTSSTSTSSSSSVSVKDAQHSYSGRPGRSTSTTTSTTTVLTTSSSAASVAPVSTKTSASVAPVSTQTTTVRSQSTTFATATATSTTGTTTTTTTTSSSVSTSSVAAPVTTATSTKTTSSVVTSTSSSAAATTTSSSVNAGSDSYKVYLGVGTTAAGWPAMSAWVDFESMWTANMAYISISCGQFGQTNNSPQESADLKTAIQSIAASSGIDARFILAVVMQESKGCVRAPTTNGGVRNPGLMQDHDGAGTCNDASTVGVLNPCPSSEITQQIKDGTTGTAAGDGLQQTLSESGASDVSKYYKAARIYNSGSIAASGKLEDGIATHCYASDIANRLTGWVQAASKCTLG